VVILSDPLATVDSVTRRRAVLGALACVAVGALLGVALTTITRRGGDRPGAGSVDVGFLQDMIDHHDQAVQMAVIELSGGSSSIARSFAGDVIASQRYEIGLMDARLEDWHAARGAPTRDVMTWMGMGVPRREMPGLASQQAIDALAKATGPAADAMFFRLMIVHHQGGLHMAGFAAEHGHDARVRALAERMVRTQSREIAEMQAAQSQLGLAP
jgi:uncharacterized protein (DUF305 family)